MIQPDDDDDDSGNVHPCHEYIHIHVQCIWVIICVSGYCTLFSVDSVFDIVKMNTLSCVDLR